MTRRKLFTLALALASLAGSLPSASAQSPPAKPMQIGMAKTFFNDVPKAFLEFIPEPFEDLMKKATGLDGKLLTKYDAFETARMLNDNQLQLGVFHGHELAWVQQKYPKLTPLMIAVNKHHDVRAFVIVHKDNPAKSVADLRAKKFAVPMLTKQHCSTYLEKHCTDNAQPKPANFFSSIIKSPSFEVALDEVARGNVQGTIVDTIALEFYKSIKGPVFNNNLRILQQSDAFPSAVIVYNPGGLDEKTLTSFREGLQKAHHLPDATEMLEMWKISSFEPIPAGYTKSLADSLKCYPAP